MKKEDKQFKCFQVRLDHNIWKFLKITAADQETSMGEIITRCITKYKNKLENRLTTEKEPIQ